MTIFDFTVDGAPLSQQAKSKANLQAWRSRVRTAANAAWPMPRLPFDIGVTFSVTQFFDGDAGDVDNIIKPIQDALIGLVYLDDSLVMDTSAHKRDLKGAFRLGGLPPEVAVRLTQALEFVWVRISDEPDYEALS